MPSSPSNNIGAVVLAAGFSRRFKSSKQLAHLENGQTILSQTIQNIEKAIEHVIIVTRPEIASQINLKSQNVFLFAGADEGMGASLAFAVKQIGSWDAVLICLADMPFIEPDTYKKLANYASQNKIIVPTYQGMAANPVVFGAHFFDEIAKLRGDKGGKSLIKSNQTAVIELPVDDPGVVQDIDIPSDLIKWR